MDTFDRLEHTNSKLKERLMRLAPETGKFVTALPDLTVFRFDGITKDDNCFYDPAIGLVLQGYKHTVIGSEAYQYGEYSCIVNGVDMPSLNNILEASREKPFLGLSLRIDRALATELYAQTPPEAATGGASCNGVSIAEVDPDVLDAFLRLVELLDDPDELRILAPIVVREIHFRILIGPQGGCLRLITTQGSQTSQVAEAITWLRDNYRERVHIDQLAKRVNMATSTFHRHFKEVTSLSPLQFRKRLRLYEAQRLMLTGDKDATGASLEVGYESPTQFNREYKKLFGEPPHRDINRMRLQM